MQLHEVSFGASAEVMGGKSPTAADARMTDILEVVGDVGDKEKDAGGEEEQNGHATKHGGSLTHNVSQHKQVHRRRHRQTRI